MSFGNFQRNGIEDGPDQGCCIQRLALDFDFGDSLPPNDFCMGPDVLDSVQLWRVGGNVQRLHSLALHELSHGLCFVGGRIVHDHNKVSAWYLPSELDKEFFHLLCFDVLLHLCMDDLSR